MHLAFCRDLVTMLERKVVRQAYRFFIILHKFHICYSIWEPVQVGVYLSMLRIRDGYPGSECFPSRIPDPHQRILRFLSSRKYVPGWFFTHPGSRIRGKKGTGSRIRIRNNAIFLVAGGSRSGLTGAGAGWWRAWPPPARTLSSCAASSSRALPLNCSPARIRPSRSCWSSQRRR